MYKETQEQLLSIVKKNYEAIAKEFSATREELHWPELERLTADAKDGDSVLDVGCGNGRLLNYLKGKKISYLGVDNSSGLIRLAKERINNFQFRIGDVLKLNEIQEKNFDWIFSVAVLHHLPGKELRVEGLKQMKGKLKGNGKIILTVWNLWQTKYWLVILKSAILKIIGMISLTSRRVSRDPDLALRASGDFGDILFDWNKGGVISQRYYHAFTKYELKRISKKAGLKVEKIYKDKYNYYMILTK